MKIEKIEMENTWEPYLHPLANAGVREPRIISHTLSGIPHILGETTPIDPLTADLGQKLSQYLEIFHPYFLPDQEKYAAAYIAGLLSDLEYKSVEPIALRYGLSVRGTQRFLSGGKWSDQQIWDTYRRHLAKMLGGGGCENGMLTVDRHETPKKGKHSVGVAHQYCGATGKVANCQSGVYIGYSSERGHGLLDCALYLPELWFDDGHKKFREKCGVPETAAFRTKASMAAEMLQKAHVSRLFPARWVGVDSFFGNSKEFLSAIPEGMWYFADTSPDTLVFREMPTMAAPTYSGRGPRSLKAVPSTAPVAAGDIAGNSGAGQTQPRVVEGPNGPIISHDQCVRVIRSENNAPSEEVWLYIHKLEGGSHKYSFCNAPPDTPVSMIRNAALMRHSMGQCLDGCKRHLGLDQYEGRSWNTWYRHNLLVFVAHLFLTCLYREMEINRKALPNLDERTNRFYGSRLSPALCVGERK